jgi:hypothetical protein
MYARADYYVWAARRHSKPCGADPVSGQPWETFTYHHSTARILGRASYAAMARECYRLARLFPNPLERVRPHCAAWKLENHTDRGGVDCGCGWGDLCDV